MNNHDIYQMGVCSLENLLDNDYPYCSVEDDFDTMPEKSLYPDVYARKHRNGYYDWENDDAI